MECYGSLFNKRKECKDCELQKWCKNASDPPRLSHQMLEWDLVSDLIVPSNIIVKHPSESISCEKSIDKQLYSRSDLLEVIGFLLSLDTQTLDMLDSKIGDPGISFSEIARRRGVSRQAVHKFIKKKCAQIPELSIILQNNSQKRKISKNFMEEVCQIKKQMLEKRLKKQKGDSRFSKKLTFWSQSLDLSKMSIFKGSNITRSALKA
jgi:predicted DNA-binding protein YlxM (UPF0122 family)